ncbi:MAG: Rpn family recombination-promoting nuclease/putative transposase [Chromatiales bacterium]|nr:Rpn family recombination-promoting nuclease/putative transposase [Chromatiales bacterium]
MPKTPRSLKPQDLVKRGHSPPRHHDHGYKQLFSHPEMVRDLLTGFVRERWVASVDLGSLEAVEGRFTSPTISVNARMMSSGAYAGPTAGSMSMSDRVPEPGRCLHGRAYRQPCRAAVSRICMARQALTGDDLLPPVLPIVLYNGEESLVGTDRSAHADRGGSGRAGSLSAALGLSPAR